MHATHRSKRRNRGRTMDAAPSQGISSGRLTSGRNRVMSSGGSGGCEKFVGEGGGREKEAKRRFDNFLLFPIERLFRKYCYSFTLKNYY